MGIIRTLFLGIEFCAIDYFGNYLSVNALGFLLVNVCKVHEKILQQLMEAETFIDFQKNSFTDTIP